MRFSRKHLALPYALFLLLLVVLATMLSASFQLVFSSAVEAMKAAEMVETSPEALNAGRRKVHRSRWKGTSPSG